MLLSFLLIAWATSLGQRAMRANQSINQPVIFPSEKTVACVQVGKGRVGLETLCERRTEYLYLFSERSSYLAVFNERSGSGPQSRCTALA